MNWEIVLAAAGFLSAPIAWIFGGKQAKKVEIKNSSADFIEKIQGIYDKWVEDGDKKQSDLKQDIENLKSEMKEMREHERSIQKQFNSIQLAYAKEVEQSQNWEKLHRQLLVKYDALEKAHEELKQFCTKLKAELDRHKKDSK
jgi:molecular chaperone GrpE (heat shock protein)